MFRDIFGPSEEVSDRDAWLAWRKKGIGASDAVIIAGLSPWKTIQELWLDKVGLAKDIEPNWAMKRGTELEPFARDIYEYQTGIKIPAKNVIHPKYEFIKASLDGWSEDERLCVEIKTPGKADLELARQGLIPEKYYPQVQWQLLCTGSDKCDYVTYDGKSTIYIKRVESNHAFQRKLLWLGRWFWAKVQARSEIERYDVRLQVPKV